MVSADEQAPDEAGEAEDWLTAGEAADYLNVSPFTLRGLAQRGELTTYRSPIDRRGRFYRRDELDGLEMQPLLTGAARGA